MPGPGETAKQYRGDGRCEGSWRVSSLRTRAEMKGSPRGAGPHNQGGVGLQEGTNCCNIA
eukprot:1965946-Prorocentrum_lima.AAC.1